MPELNPQNTIHWLMDPLGEEALRVLRWMRRGRHEWASDQWNEAVLIARGCAVPDYDTRTYIVTDKGDDALEHWI